MSCWVTFWCSLAKTLISTTSDRSLKEATMTGKRFSRVVQLWGIGT